MVDRVTVEQLQEMRGRRVVSSDGQEVGDFRGFYYDDSTGAPEWIAAEKPKLGGLLGTDLYLIPADVVDVAPGSEELRVPYTKDRIEQAPTVDGGEISEEQEDELYRHYGVSSYGTSRVEASEETVDEPRTVDTFREEGTVGGPGDTEDTLSRHEEEMRVGRREVERGQVRLRKWVEVEPTSETTNLRRETASIERESVDRPAPNAQLGDEEVEMTLHEEEPVVEKEIREKERFGLEREVESHEETVHGEVRKERVEAEGDFDEEGRRKSA